MAKNKYITRENGVGTLIYCKQEDMYIELKNILGNYKYIKKAIKKENHIFERPYGDFFREILYEKKVVGFAMYENYGNKTILNEIYIMPKFRKYNLFIRELYFMCNSGSNPCIYLARRDMVKEMMEEGFAAELKDGIVVSSIEFAFSYDDALCTDDSFFDFEDFYFSPFFDLKINSSFYVDDNRLFYSVMNRNDFKKYGLSKHLNDTHFNDLRKCINQNIQEIERIIEETEDNLPQSIFDYDTIVGDGESLSEYMEGLIKEGVFDHDRAIEIRDILREDYKNGFVEGYELIPRMIHLVATESNERLDSKFDFEKKLQDDDFQNSLKKLEDGDFDHARKNLEDGILDLILANIKLDDFNHLNVDEDEKSQMIKLLEIINEDEELLKRFKDAYKEDDLSSFAELIIDAAEDADIDADFLFREYDDAISYDLDIFRVLSAIVEWEDYVMMKENIELECGMSFDSFVQFLSDEDYLKIIDSKDWNDYSSVYKLEDLKEILRENDLRLSGKKQELIDRLNDNAVETNPIFSLSNKGIKYLKDYAWIEFYENFLLNFDFNNFYNFYLAQSGTLYDISLDFLNRNMEQAISIDDEVYINNCNEAIKAIKEEGKDLLDSLGLE